MNAVERYREFTDVPLTHYLPDATLRSKADAAIAELEAELEAMKEKYDDGEYHTGQVIQWVADCGTCRGRTEMCTVAFNDPECEDWVGGTAMTAVEEYRKATREMHAHGYPTDAIKYADAAIAELEQAYEAILTEHGHEMYKRERLQVELQAAQWAITQWHAEEDDWIRGRERLETALSRADDAITAITELTAALNRANAATTREEAKLAAALAEVTRLHDICDRLAEAGHRGDGT